MRPRFYLIVCVLIFANILLQKVVGVLFQKIVTGLQPWLLFGWMLVVIFFVANRAKKQAFDIADQAGIIMMVSTIIMASMLYFFQLLFTSQLIISCVATTLLLAWVQWKQGIRLFYFTNSIGVEMQYYKRLQRILIVWRALFSLPFFSQKNHLFVLNKID